MLYKFITSGNTDALAYASAAGAAIWLYLAGQYSSALPAEISLVSPLYGIAVAAFFGALLICKYACLEGSAETINTLTAEKAVLEGAIRTRDLKLVQSAEAESARVAEISTLKEKIAALEENSPTVQLSELRKKLRISEEDRRSALTMLSRNLLDRLNMIPALHDDQLTFAVDVLRKEIGLVENEIKRGQLSFNEVCLKIIDISQHLSDLKELIVASDQSTGADSGKIDDAWLHFIHANDDNGPAAEERAFKFFRVAFHPDRYTSEALKSEATRYFQHSVNAHNAAKRRKKDAA